MREKQKKFILYHLYNRGNRKKRICSDSGDFNYLLNLIKATITNKHYDLLSICIMPNHYHILIAQTGSKSIGSAMASICCKYTHYFNKKYNYVGHLFQGAYKYKAVSRFNYFNWLVRYIRNNNLQINEDCRDSSSKYYENKKLVNIYEFFLRTAL